MRMLCADAGQGLSGPEHSAGYRVAGGKAGKAAVKNGRLCSGRASHANKLIFELWNGCERLVDADSQRCHISVTGADDDSDVGLSLEMEPDVVSPVEGENRALERDGRRQNGAV